MAHRLDLHIHSCYSRFDGMMSPKAILKLSQEAGYDAIAVTDHYTYDGALRGTLATQRLAADHGLTAYTGLEYHVTEGPIRGHVLLYFDDVDQVPERGLRLTELMDHARDENLLVIHPHPYGYAGIQDPAFMEAADYVELNGSYHQGPVNGRLLREANRGGFAAKLVGNSDAHARGQIGAAYTLTTELHQDLQATLSTRVTAGLAEPRRAWGKAAKLARAIVQPVGWMMNSVQRLATRRALAAARTAPTSNEAGAAGS